jgi:hypothetical protein
MTPYIYRSYLSYLNSNENTRPTYNTLVNNINDISGIHADALNIKPVYDISGVVVTEPKIGTLYYDISGRLINFPSNKSVYDEIGNIITTPPLVGFMLDSTGNPIDLPVYDIDKKVIQDITKYTGPVYNSYHNLLQFPYFDSSGKYSTSYIMTPAIFKFYTSYLNSYNNTTKSSTYSDVSYGLCSVDYSKSLDDYISDYYQHFWNQHKKTYSDDYILKSSIVLNNSANDVKNNSCGWNNLYNGVQNNQSGLGGIGSGVQNVLATTGQNAQAVAGGIGSGVQNVLATTGQNAQAVAGGIGSGVQNVLTTTGQNVQAVAGGIGSGVQNVLTTTGQNVQAVAGGIGSGLHNVFSSIGSGIRSELNVNPTPIQPSVDNNKGLSGNYIGDNSTTNMGYLRGTNPFPNPSINNVANFNNNYNASPLISSNFVPITADFSNFAR